MVIRRESAFSRRIVSENTLTVQIVLYILMKRGEDVLETLQKYPNQKLCEKFEFQNIAQEDIKEAALLGENGPAHPKSAGIIFNGSTQGHRKDSRVYKRNLHGGMFPQG